MKKKKMTGYDACAAIEGFDGQDHTGAEIIKAVQCLIDNGMAWTLQGFYGRLATQYIEAGVCHRAKA